MKLAQFPRSHFRSTLRFIIASAWSLAYLLPLSALIASEPLAKGIQDNSFFIEEAYNQEPGVKVPSNAPLLNGRTASPAEDDQSASF